MKRVFSFLAFSIGLTQAAPAATCYHSPSTRGLYYFEYVDVDEVSVTVEVGNLDECNRELRKVERQLFPYTYYSCEPGWNKTGTIVAVLSAGLVPNSQKFYLNRVHINKQGQASVETVDEIGYWKSGGTRGNEHLAYCLNEQKRRLAVQKARANPNYRPWKDF